MINKILIAAIFLNTVFLFSQNVIVESFGTGFTKPVNIQHAGDDRLFIVEQDGKIKILNANGTTNVADFLNIDAIVRSVGNEQGLLGLAFHPNYSTNGFFFVNYINNSGDTVIARYTVSVNANIADSNSGQIILTISQPYTNHNGGNIVFGPDGYLYIGMGDGGSAGDPQNNAQNGNSLLGKILRIDVGVATTANYTIPIDNPYIGNASILDEIWAIGVRNPWRFSFDSTNGDLWIGDVGQNSKEEINHVVNGMSAVNYGWRCYEASDTYNTAGCGNSTNYTFPVAEYNQGGSPYKCSITGGFVYRGAAYSNFTGLYFYADYCSNEIFTVNPNNAYQVIQNGPFEGGISSFGQDVTGELYYSGLYSGEIYKIKDATLETEEVIFIQNITLEPNPTNSKTKIKTNNDNYILRKIQIFNVLGKLMQTVNIKNISNYELNLSNFDKGIYFVKIHLTNNKSTIKKLIIE